MPERYVVILIGLGAFIFYGLSAIRRRLPKNGTSLSDTPKTIFQYYLDGWKLLRKNLWLFLLPFCIADLVFISKFPLWLKFRENVLKAYDYGGRGTLEILRYYTFSSPYHGGNLWQPLQLDAGFYSSYNNIITPIYNYIFYPLLDGAFAEKIYANNPKFMQILLIIIIIFIILLIFFTILFLEGVILVKIKSFIQSKAIHREELFSHAKKFFVRLLIINIFLEIGIYLLRMVTYQIAGASGFYQLKVLQNILPNIFALIFFITPFAVLFENNFLRSLKNMFTVIKQNLLLYLFFVLSGGIVMFLISLVTFHIYFIIPTYSYPALGIEFVVMTVKVGFAVVFSLAIFKWYLDKQSSRLPA